MNQNTLAQLYHAYRRPNRHFHNLEHISDCFLELNEAIQAGVHIDNEEALRFAIWFHDYVYEGTLSTNEELSAKAAYETALREGYDETFAKLVEHMVLVTKHTDKYPCTTPDEELLCDIDLTSLAADDFSAKTELIREEYNHVPEALFRSERKKILATFNKRPRIYRTEYFHNKYDAKARENLTKATA